MEVKIMKKESVLGVPIQEEEIFEETSKVPAGKEQKVSRKPKTGKAANSKYVQIRRGPSPNSQIVANMSCGDTAIILDRVSGYYRIQTEKEGNVGYVSSNYFKED